ncbi:hypothetical protein GW17_00006560, partial [Ensete ventricosum]
RFSAPDLFLFFLPFCLATVPLTSHLPPALRRPCGWLWAVSNSIPSTPAACGRRSVGYPLFVLEVSTLVRTRREAMAFQGTTTKCTACAKTVYLVDKLTADNRVYHRACFRCHHCKGTLKVRPYPPPPPKLMCSNADIELKYSLQNANKVSSAFAGTREKCVGCKKTVYPIERVISLI